MVDWLELLNDRIRLGADIHLEPISGSFRRQSGNLRRWFRRLKADIRLGHLGAWAGDRNSRESSRSDNAQLVKGLSQSRYRESAFRRC